MTNGANRLDEIEQWWALIARVLAFFLGGTLLTVLILSKSETFIAYLAVVALCGPTVAVSVATMIRAARGLNGK